MNFLKYSCLVPFLLFPMTTLASETKTLIASHLFNETDGPVLDTFTINAGEIAVVESLTKVSSGSGSGGLIIQRGDTTTRVISSAPNAVFAGPMSLSASAESKSDETSSYFQTILTFTVYSQSEYQTLKNGVSPIATTLLNQPSGSVVIPEDASGPVDIILESSIDMVTWAATNPGTYGSSNAGRFFRVRAVAQ